MASCFDKEFGLLGGADCAARRARRQDGIEPGQTSRSNGSTEGNIVSFAPSRRRNRGLVDALLACPEKDWFQPIPSESTRFMDLPS